MAFDANGLLSFGTGGHLSGQDRRAKLWHYVTNDAISVVATNGYFDVADDNFQTGDVIIVVGDVDGTIAGEFYTMVVTAGDVALTKFTDAI